MKQFVTTLNQKYTFSSCASCEANCCDGRKGTIYAQIILSDFEGVYENYPILFLFGELGYIKPVILLTNGKDFCRFPEDSKCSIYDKRSSICKNYPLSSHIDNNIYIDTLCPAVNDESENKIEIINNSTFRENFHDNSLNNYQDKYIEMFEKLSPYGDKKDFSIVKIINGIKFYKCNKDIDNKYMQMHQKSLEHLQNEYFIDLD